jgi:acetyl esterase
MAQLEPGTKHFIDVLTSQTTKPLYELPINEARNFLESIQSTPVVKQPAHIEDLTIINDIKISIYRPYNYDGSVLPIIMYFHGGGWILGSKNTHDRLLREITNGTHSAVIFVDYTRAPEAQFPVQLDQAYTATQYVVDNALRFKLDPSRLVVAGDSVGGNMATVLTLIAKYRGGPKILYQALFYPVTNANFNTESYEKFANGPWLSRPAMKWFWDAYCPNLELRNSPLLSPLQSSLEELSGLPPALIILDENDVLRDEGEAYAHKLMNAGVYVTAVRYLGTLHDFLMLNPIADRPATRDAIAMVNLMIFNLFWKK